MGADIYVKKVYDEHKAKTRPAFDAAVKARDEHAIKHRGKLFGGVPFNKTQQKVHDRLQKVVEKTFDVMNDTPAYFRDSYNASNTLNRFGMSWWKDIKTNKKGEMSVAAAKEFRERVASATMDVEQIRVDIESGKWEKSATLEKVIKYHNRKRENLLKLLDLSIELKTPVYCSV